MMVTGKQAVIPTISLVRNIGLDGSGDTMPKNNMEMQNLYDSIPTSNESHFEFVGTGYEEYEYNNKLYLNEREWQGKWFFFKRMIRKIVKYMINH